MTREDIIHMAREAGGALSCIAEPLEHPWKFSESELIRFAALIASRVAAHIRETEFKPDWNNYRQGFADGAAEEREACAMLVENFAIDMDDEWVCGKAAEAIRARGENKMSTVSGLDIANNIEREWRVKCDTYINLLDANAKELDRAMELLRRAENEMRYAGWTKFESDNPARNGVYEQVKRFLK